MKELIMKLLINAIFISTLAMGIGCNAQAACEKKKAANWGVRAYTSGRNKIVFFDKAGNTIAKYEFEETNPGYIIYVPRLGRQFRFNSFSKDGLKAIENFPIDLSELEDHSTGE